MAMMPKRMPVSYWMLFGLLFLLLPQTRLLAQSEPPTSATGLEPTDPVGSPGYTPAIRDTETVSLQSLDLSMFLPVLTLPQRNGSNLTIGYYHNAFQWRANIDVQAIDYGDGGDGQWWMDNTYTASLQPTPNSQYPLDSPLQINLPTLSASSEYVGDSGVTFGEWGYGYPTFCVEEWIFTDWEGDMHQFSGASTSCSVNPNLLSGGGASVVDNAYNVTNIAYSGDTAFLKFDGTNSNDIVITDKSGTQYHFTTYRDPFPQGATYIANANGENFYQSIFSSIVDTNGNTITYADGVLTDTTGKKVTISQSGVSYTDSNGTTQQVVLQPLSQPTLPVGGAASDTWTFPDWNCQFYYSNPGDPSFSDPEINFSFDPAPVVGGYTTYQVQFPKADGANQRTFTYTFDGLSRIAQVWYPSGGYTRYAYQSQYVPYGSGTAAANVYACSTDASYISDKYECSASNGSCAAGSGNTEAHTQYSISSTQALQAGYLGTVIDPVGNTMYYIPSTGGGNSSLDTENLDASGNKVRTVHNTFTPQTGDGNEYQLPILPSSTVETDYTSSGSLTKTTKYQYQYFQYAAYPAYWGYTDNVTEKDEYDYDSTWVRSTTNQWNPPGSFTQSYILDRISSSTVTDEASAASIEASYSYDTLGNVTQKVLTGSDGVSLTTTYNRDSSKDPYHRVTSMVDPANNTTSYSYSDNSWANASCATAGTNSYAFLTSIKNAANQTRNFFYNSCTGTLGNSVDVNGNTTAYVYDALGRKTATCYPDAFGILWSSSNPCSPVNLAASIVNSYNDSIPNSVVASVQTGNNSIQTKTVFDGVSRTSASILTSDPSGAAETDTTYDLDGRVASVSNPYRAATDPTYGITYYQYDWAGRKIAQEQPDKNYLYWCYDGKKAISSQPNCVADASTYAGDWVDSTDESGNHIQHVSDALGRLRAVMEPNPSSPTTLSLETDYTYDGFNNLTAVNQNGKSGDSPRTRGFAYDTLSRLTSSTNTETGTVTYQYINASNAFCAGDPSLPCSKTDARNITTNYSYDSLNRLTSKTYSSAPPGTMSSCYQYDGSETNGIGHLVSSWTQSGACMPQTGIQSSRTILGYDAMGRVTSEHQCTPGNCPASSSAPYSLSYSYDLAGNQVSANDGIAQASWAPSYDAAGRLSGVSATTLWPTQFYPSQLFSAQTYSPAGGLMNWTMGVPSSGSAALTGSKAYDNRLRPTQESVTGHE